MSALAIATAAQLSNLRNNLTSDAYLTADIDLSATMMAADNWAASTFYRQWVVVKVSAESKIYRCLADHTSGTFADDLAAGKWEYIRDYVPTYSSSSTYAVGAEVVYSNNIYQCITAITVPEAFNATKWMQLGSTSTGWLVIAPLYGSPFSGAIDGKNHTIKNLYCRSTSGTYGCNFFGVYGGSSVKDITLKDFCFAGGSSSGNVACFAGLIRTSAVLQNVKAIKCYVKSKGAAGGFSGTGSQAVFIDCAVNAVIESTNTSAVLGALCGGGCLSASGSRNILVSGRIIGAGSNKASGIGSTEKAQKISNAVINISFEGAFATVAGITALSSASNAITNIINIGSKSGTATTTYGIAPVSAQVSSCYVINTFGGSDTAHQKTSAQLKQRETFAGWNFKRDWYLPADDNWVEKLFPPNDGYPCLRTLWDFSIPSVSGGFGALRGRYNY